MANIAALLLFAACVHSAWETRTTPPEIVQPLKSSNRGRKARDREQSR
ncbi:MAG TPA: hypothetical protein VL225_04235 [Vicinamibacterales bacterium]|jgi:hypothetical protein|nr:hypothetical protein [Vicinamibacterales bacterium]